MDSKITLHNLINQCCFGCPFDPILTFYELFMFTLFSLLLILLLGFYYDRIQKGTKKADSLTNPIFNSKDILLQEITYEGDYFPIAKSISTTNKVILILLILLIATTPFHELLGLSIFY